MVSTWVVLERVVTWEGSEDAWVVSTLVVLVRVVTWEGNEGAWVVSRPVS